MANQVKLTDGLELWVWDLGRIEGFAVYVNGLELDRDKAEQIRYRVRESGKIVVQFVGADGGATKLVDTRHANKVLAFQDSGVRHAYSVTN